jgi:hypothetical protein
MRYVVAMGKTIRVNPELAYAPEGIEFTVSNGPETRFASARDTSAERLK